MLEKNMNKNKKNQLTLNKLMKIQYRRKKGPTEERV